jgi:hypothetical protein
MSRSCWTADGDGRVRLSSVFPFATPCHFTIVSFAIICAAAQTALGAAALFHDFRIHTMQVIARNFQREFLHCEHW